jgi:hypothetical protein
MRARRLGDWFRNRRRLPSRRAWRPADIAGIRAAAIPKNDAHGPRLREARSFPRPGPAKETARASRYTYGYRMSGRHQRRTGSDGHREPIVAGLPSRQRRARSRVEGSVGDRTRHTRASTKQARASGDRGLEQRLPGNSHHAATATGTRTMSYTPMTRTTP